jgi:hypothetical protein
MALVGPTAALAHVRPLRRTNCRNASCEIWYPSGLNALAVEPGILRFCRAQGGCHAAHEVFAKAGLPG